ncbi:16S rRNA (guanine(527)-N(7))-methyltransferase RsmG [Plastorhodobacter daqingensis]|uniref:Ribosomal RNA small subunit methyltransferase G n=1 Tax=Plastorhodobacter daqingensis TaxID=1387281 RepID=A0ABW2UER6_9RHOB
MSQDAFRAALDVSRETLERLDQYEALLRKWNAAINLVSSGSLKEVWSRHFLDSAQVFSKASDARTWADMGSGGGFPGIVVAILAAAEAPDLRVTLVESDLRKATFLTTVVRELSLGAAVIPERIEKVPPLAAQVVSARALAPLSQLLGHADRHLAPGGRAVFLKGGSWPSEVEEAQKHWKFEFEAHKSKTDPSGVILTIGAISRV